jgi:hypothetical protein
VSARRTVPRWGRVLQSRWLVSAAHESPSGVLRGLATTVYKSRSHEPH